MRSSSSMTAPPTAPPRPWWRSSRRSPHFRRAAPCPQSGPEPGHPYRRAERPRARSSSPWTATARTIPPTSAEAAGECCAPIQALGMVSGVRAKRQDTPAAAWPRGLGNWLPQSDAGRRRHRHRLRHQGVLPRRLPRPSLFRSFPSLSDRAGAARGLESRLCAGQSPPAGLRAVPNTPIWGGCWSAWHDLLGVRWLQRRHGGRARTEEL